MQPAYNARLLSALLEYYAQTGDIQGVSLVKQVSPVAWQHINFQGRYEFSRGPNHIIIADMIRQLAQIQVDTGTAPTTQIP